jgi:hypothetical protein
VETFAARGRSLELKAPRSADVGDYDPHYLGLALDSFVNWRAAVAPRGDSARLSWRARNGAFHLEWVETRGPGPAERRGEPRGAETPSELDPLPAEPLALPLLTRIVSVHGGTLEQVKASGRHLRLTWPQLSRPRSGP